MDGPTEDKELYLNNVDAECQLKDVRQLEAVVRPHDERNLQQNHRDATLQIEEATVGPPEERDEDLIASVQAIFPQLSSLCIGNLVSAFNHVPRDVLLDTLCSFIVENNDLSVALDATFSVAAVERDLDAPGTSKQIDGGIQKQPKALVTSEIPCIIIDDDSDETREQDDSTSDWGDFEPLVMKLPLVDSISTAGTNLEGKRTDLCEVVTLTDGIECTTEECGMPTAVPKNHLKRKYCDGPAQPSRSEKALSGKEDAPFCDVSCSLTKSSRTDSQVANSRETPTSGRQKEFSKQLISGSKECSTDIPDKICPLETSSIAHTSSSVIILDEQECSKLSDVTGTLNNTVTLDQCDHPGSSDILSAFNGSIHDKHHYPSSSAIAVASQGGVGLDSADHPRPPDIDRNSSGPVFDDPGCSKPFGIAAVSSDGVPGDKVGLLRSTSITTTPQDAVVDSEPETLTSSGISSAPNDVIAGECESQAFADLTSIPIDNVIPNSHNRLYHADLDDTDQPKSSDIATASNDVILDKCGYPSLFTVAITSKDGIDLDALPHPRPTAIASAPSGAIPDCPGQLVPSVTAITPSVPDVFGHVSQPDIVTLPKDSVVDEFASPRSSGTANAPSEMIFDYSKAAHNNNPTPDKFDYLKKLTTSLVQKASSFLEKPVHRRASGTAIDHNGIACDKLDQPRPTIIAITPNNDAPDGLDNPRSSGIDSISTNVAVLDELAHPESSSNTDCSTGSVVLGRHDHPVPLDDIVALPVSDISLEPDHRRPSGVLATSSDLHQPGPSGFVLVPNNTSILDELTHLELSDIEVNHSCAIVTNEKDNLKPFDTAFVSTGADLDSPSYAVSDNEELECNCCYSEVPFDYMVQCTEGHLFCCECLRRYTQEAVYGGGKVKLLCMADGCATVFPKSQLQRALPADLFKRYEEREAEESLNLAGLENLVRCPHCNYGAELEEGQLAFTCQNLECKRITCRLCQKDWKIHKGLTCQQVETETETNIRLKYEEQMANAKIRQCHRCKAKYTKEDGCNKITCRCGAAMCYLCRQPVNGYNHFCNHQQRKKKPCELCNLHCALWTNAEEDDAQAIAELKQQADQARAERGFQEKKEIGAPEEPRKPPRKSSRHRAVPVRQVFVPHWGAVMPGFNEAMQVQVLQREAQALYFDQEARAMQANVNQEMRAARQQVRVEARAIQQQALAEVKAAQQVRVEARAIQQQALAEVKAAQQVRVEARAIQQQALAEVKAARQQVRVEARAIQKQALAEARALHKQVQAEVKAARQQVRHAAQPFPNFQNAVVHSRSHVVGNNLPVMAAAAGAAMPGVYTIPAGSAVTVRDNRNHNFPAAPVGINVHMQYPMPCIQQQGTEARGTALAVQGRADGSQTVTVQSNGRRVQAVVVQGIGNNIQVLQPEHSTIYVDGIVLWPRPNAIPAPVAHQNQTDASAPGTSTRANDGGTSS